LVTPGGGPWASSSKYATRPESRPRVTSRLRTLHRTTLALVVLISGSGLPSAEAAPATCHGEPATIVGTSGGDKLIGTSARDVIAAFGGRDIVKAGDGDDLVCGGNGSDRLYGQDGEDRLYGQRNGDGVFGGSGDDVLDVGEAPPRVQNHVTDWFYGEAGNDTYIGSGEEDGTRTVIDFKGHGPVNVDFSTGTVTGAGGTDTIEGVTGAGGTPGADVFVGTEANEQFTGDAYETLSDEADHFDAGGGNDYILGGDGPDDIQAGPGNDRIYPGGPGASIDADVGTDMVIYALSSGSLNIDLSTGTVNGNPGRLLGVENLQGSNSKDTITGDEGPNFLRGLGGVDEIRGAGGNDTIAAENASGDEGEDTFTSVPGATKFDGGPGTDSVSFPEAVEVDLAAGTATGNGDDTLTGIETVKGSPNEDVLKGDAGPNHLIGGAGNDEIDGRGGTDDLEGGAGDDVCLNGETTSSCEVSELPSFPLGPGIFAHGRCNKPDAIVGTKGANHLVGTEGNDVICGLGGHDSIEGKGGRDIIFGGGGGDQVDAGGGDDGVHGGSGSDDISAGADNDLTLGDGGNDRLVGGGGDDVQVGGAGADRLKGGTGNDADSGGSGVDLLDGGDGTDSCIGGPGDDRYADCESCGVAPRGSAIAFSRVIPYEEHGRPGVYTMQPNGKKESRVSGDLAPPWEGHAYTPAWSPNGSKLAFGADRYHTALYTVRSNGRGLKRMWKHSHYSAFTPDWDPKRHRIAFEAERLDDESFDVFSVREDGTHSQALTSSESGRFHPHYSPDGRKIALEGNTPHYDTRALTMHPDGSGEGELLDNRISYDPSWAPSSHWVAFAASPTSAKRFDARTQIFLSDAGGHVARQITHTRKGTNDSPQWSPDGLHIAFVSTRDGEAEIYIMASDGTSVRKITHMPGRESDPRWSPDGSTILFEDRRGRDGPGDLYRIGLNGRHLRRLTNTPLSELEATWRPRACH
jgi:Tol biopolymer transport system component/Ca2+-binding RTX toxin-like protein